MPGQGSCFWLWWPADVEQSIDAPLLTSQTTAQKGWLARLQGRCLLVQSDVVGVAVLEKLLQSWGVQVQRANGLEQARRLGAEWQPDFVLCDQSLQNAENGFECLEQLLEQWPNASGALLSDDQSSLEQALDQGYLALSKPLQPEQLHAVLARCMAS